MTAAVVYALASVACVALVVAGLLRAARLAVEATRRPDPSEKSARGVLSGCVSAIDHHDARLLALEVNLEDVRKLRADVEALKRTERERSLERAAGRGR